MGRGCVPGAGGVPEGVRGASKVEQGCALGEERMRYARRCSPKRSTRGRHESDGGLAHRGRSGRLKSDHQGATWRRGGVFGSATWDEVQSDCVATLQQ